MAKQKDGRYRAGVVIGHDKDGKAITKWISARTKRDLEAAREEVLRTYVYGVTDPRREILFGVYAQEWYDTYKKPHLSESSRRNYGSIFSSQLYPALANRQLRAISAPELQQLLNGMQGMGKTSIGYVSTILRGVFGTAYANGIIDRDPSTALKKPASVKRSKRALTEGETVAALRVGREHPDGLLLLLLYYTGARRGEALGLQWRDVDFDSGLIYIRRDIDFVTGRPGELKTACSERCVPMPDELAEALRPRRGVGETYILQAPKTGSHWQQSTFERHWRQLMAAMYAADPSIEAEDGRSILTAHYFRHNYASVLYNAGVDVLAAQKYMGHADVKTTLSIYAHLSEGLELKSAEKVREAFRGGVSAQNSEGNNFAKSLPAQMQGRGKG